MIIQTGMRTDIPAFYSEWFINRIKEGFVMVRNPYNPSQVTKYSLSPDVVDLIAFCSKNPSPMSPFLIGNSETGDVIHEADQKSWIDNQLRLNI